MADSGDSADHDGVNTAGDDSNNEATNTLTERTVPSVLPILTLETTVGCSTCDACKRSIKKGYPRAVCSNCNVQVSAILNERRSAMATVAVRAGERTWGLQSYKGTISTHCTQK